MNWTIGKQCGLFIGKCPTWRIVWDWCGVRYFVGFRGLKPYIFYKGKAR